MPDAPAALRRDLGLWGAASIVVGTVIGSGIFLVPKTMTQQVGTPGRVFFVWIFGGMLSLFGALTYAELAAALPEAGGEYAFLREAYGPVWAYLYGWMQLFVGKPGSIATLATGFFLYLYNFFPDLEQVWMVIPLPLGESGRPLEIRYGQLAAMALILFLGAVNHFGVKFGGNVQVAVTVLKVALIAGIIAVGLTSSQGTVANFQTAAPAAGGWTGFFAALVAALWAYDGWNNLSMVSSEVRQPRRNLPLALILGTLTVVGIYLLMNLAYFYVLPAPAVASADRVAGEMMRRILGAPGAAGVGIAAMISIFAALNGSILSGSRVPYAMAADGRFFSGLAYVHPKWGTPSVSIFVLSAWAALLVLSGRYEQLYTYVIFSSAIFYAMAASAVIVLRIRRPGMPRPYKVLGYPFVPVLFIVSLMALIVSTLMKSPRESFLGLAIIGAGFLLYFRWRPARPDAPATSGTYP